MNAKLGWLQYSLADFLETHYSEDRLVVDQLVRKILAFVPMQGKLSQLSCVALGDTLIVVQNGHRKRLRRLHLLSRHRSKSRVVGLERQRG